MPQKNKTASSTAAPQKEEKRSIIANEKARYESKGFGLVFGVLTFAAFVVFWPDVCRAVWQWSLDFMKKHDLTEGQYYLIFGCVNTYGWNLILHGFYGFLYKIEHPMIERYKVLEEPWPWNDDKSAWNALLWKTIPRYFCNALVIGPLGYLPFYLMDLPVDLDTSMEGIPGSVKMLAQILFCMFMEDLTFYCSHRMLHRPWIYPYIHKIHHEHKITFSIAYAHAHPLEYIFGNLLPSAVGPLILGSRIHWMTAFTWYVLRLIESVEGHSGYEFSWSPFRVLPFGSDYGYHAYHHSHNIGNYSSFFTVWDTVFGSNKVYYTWMQEQEAESKAKKAK